jgi:hypothetical protein
MRFAIVLDSGTVFFFLLFLTLPLGLLWLDYPPVHQAIVHWIWRYWPFIVAPIFFTVALFWFWWQNSDNVDTNLFIPVLIVAFFASMTVAEWIYPTPKPKPNPALYPSCAEPCRPQGY